MSISGPPRLLQKAYVEYIRNQIESGDPFKTKKALQLLCSLYRRGNRISPTNLNGVEQSIVGLLMTRSGDEKVRRWALNAIARLGRAAFSTDAVMYVLDRYSEEPQTTAAGIAALYRMNREASKLLAKLDYDQQMVTLAALQHVDENQLDMSCLPINAEKASPDLLRLGLVLVGLDRAPKNMLNPRFSNAEMVKVLGSHDDPIVSQYSVWAITENSDLTIDDLGVDMRDVESLPENVKSWIFQLIGMSAKNLDGCKEYIDLAVRDDSAEVRGGMAVGLRDNYFQGLESLILDWLVNEADAQVQEYLIDHMVKMSSHCEAYIEICTQLYIEAGVGSSKRQRMDANAAGTPMYAKLRQVSLEQHGDLFNGGGIMNQTINVQNIQGAAVSIGGQATNAGEVSNTLDARTIELLSAELAKAEAELHKLQAAVPEAAEALVAVEAAKVEPSKGKVAKALEALEKVEQGATRLHGAGTAIVAISKAIVALYTGIPS